MGKVTRRQFLRGAGLAAGSLAAPAIMGFTTGKEVSEIHRMRSRIEHVVVIFQENRSFDHYFGTFRPNNGRRVSNLLDDDGKISHRFYGIQKNAAGVPYANLPIADEENSFQSVEIGNFPFHLSPYIPATARTPWLNYDNRFFRTKAAVNGGKMDGFVSIALGREYKLNRSDILKMTAEQLRFRLSRPTGSVMGYYTEQDIPFYHQIAHHFVLFDRFYEAIYGGSLGNALYLVSGRSAVNPSISENHVAPLFPQSGLDDNAIFNLPYDHNRIIVHDLPPVQGPTRCDQEEDLRLSPPPEAQNYDNIGDRLNQAKVSWAWYNENWDRVKMYANKSGLGPGQGSAIVDTSQLYVAHHNPFQYYPRWKEYVRDGHMRDSNDFLEDARQGNLPALSFIKAAGSHDEHPGHSSPTHGMNWAEKLVRSVANGPSWDKTAIFITYDEGGGFWDSMPPVNIDEYGLGERIPALLISPYARQGYIDHHVASTASILKFVETRFGLHPLTHRDRDAYDMLSAFNWSQKPREFDL